MNTMFSTLLAAAVNITVENPIDGSTGVWVKSGTTVIGSGMKMTGATVTVGQSQYVYNRGVAQSCAVSSGGFQYVSSGGVTNGTLIVYGGSSIVSSAGVASNTVVCGRFYVNALGSAFDTIISAVPGQQSAAMLVSADAQRRGYASGIYVYSNGAFYARSRNCYNAIVYSGGLAQVFQYSELHSTTVNASGRMLVTVGGTGVSVTVSSGGTLTVSSGGTALAVTSNTGATVTVRDGGYIEYA